jgi:hypothetical protein
MHTFLGSTGLDDDINPPFVYAGSFKCKAFEILCPGCIGLIFGPWRRDS